MGLLPVLQYPDERLRTPCAQIAVFDASLRDLADDLLDTMRAAPGIGITAAHVGRLVRLAVIELQPGADPFVAANPRILWSSSEIARHPEGSVSMPGIVEDVDRPARVKAAWQTLDGDVREAEFDGLMSVCVQHEIDQLDGIFWIDRLSRLRRERAEKRFLKQLRRQTG